MVAASQQDPAIGITFEAAAMFDALRQEYDMPADIILWHGAASTSDRKAALRVLARAGELVIGDPVCSDAQKVAA